MLRAPVKCEDTLRCRQHQAMHQLHALVPIVYPTPLVLPLPQFPICSLNQFRLPLSSSSNTSFPYRPTATVELASLLALDLFTDSNRLVASESLSHIYHAPFAIAIALFKLLAACGEGFHERRAQTVCWGVAVYEDAVGVLEAGG